MRAILLILLLTSAASADEMSPIGCNALGVSAANAADRLEDVLKTMHGAAFRAAVPHMPPSAQPAAADVDDTRKVAEISVSDYAKALRDFSEKIKNWGK
ncbi:MAG: hypothetical protein E5W82_10935 [Mesorhizobium sp.]|nr:MAG: hypothetical protein E5W82_10935 [Mesorhizobium sp.]